MHNRILAILLVFALLISGFALAEAIPSATVENIITITGVTSSANVVLPETFKVEIVPMGEQTAKVAEELTEVVKTAPVAEYFGSEAITTAIAKLPVETEISSDSLKLNELTTVTAIAYDPSFEDVVVTMNLTAEYRDDDSIVVLVGVVWDDMVSSLFTEEVLARLFADGAIPVLPENGSVLWLPMDAAIVDGQVNVTFIREVLLAAENSEVLFALLRAE